METMKQIRNEFRKAVAAENPQPGKSRDHTRLSLKSFAKQHAVLEIVKAAHKSASKPRSEAKKLRTRAGILAKKQKKQKVSKPEAS